MQPGARQLEAPLALPSCLRKGPKSCGFTCHSCSSLSFQSLGGPGCTAGWPAGPHAESPLGSRSGVRGARSPRLAPSSCARRCRCHVTPGGRQGAGEAGGQERGRGLPGRPLGSGPLLRGGGRVTLAAGDRPSSAAAARLALRGVWASHRATCSAGGAGAPQGSAPFPAADVASERCFNEGASESNGDACDLGTAMSSVPRKRKGPWPPRVETLGGRKPCQAAGDRTLSGRLLVHGSTATAKKVRF